MSEFRLPPPGRWSEPDLDLLRQNLSRALIACVTEISRDDLDDVLDRGAPLHPHATGRVVALDLAVRGRLNDCYRAEQWLTSPVNGVTLAGAIRRNGLDAAELIARRLHADSHEELYWVFEQLFTVPGTVTFPRLEELGATVWSKEHVFGGPAFLMLSVGDQAVSDGIDAPADRVDELGRKPSLASDLERFRLNALAVVVEEYLVRDPDGDVDAWLLQPVNSWGSLAANIMPWDTDTIELLIRYLPAQT